MPEPPPDPSALPKPDHVPPHDRFFEDGEEPPERYDLDDEAAYLFDIDWKVTPRNWFTAARQRYVPFLKRAFWISLAYVPAWLLGWHVVLLPLLILLEPLGRTWLIRQSLDQLATGRGTPDPRRTYNSLLLLNFLTALWMYLGGAVAVFALIEADVALEFNKPWRAVGGFAVFAFAILALVAIHGRLTRFAYILIVDRGFGAFAAMATSWRMWRGRFSKLFALEILSFLLQCGSFVYFGIGLVFALPFITLFWSAAYLSALGEAPERDPKP